MKVTNICTVIIHDEKFTLDRIEDEKGQTEYASYYWDAEAIEEGEPCDVIFPDIDDSMPEYEAINQFLEYLNYKQQ